jgi:hypothetical protein
MVNGRLKLRSSTADIGQMAPATAKRAHFRHENCVNQQPPMRLGALRSRFGSADSWSIN